jgi:hypothetical protein
MHQYVKPCAHAPVCLQFGQLGVGDLEDRNSPTPVTTLAGNQVVLLACGWRHTLAVTATGQVFTWGRGVNGQLGHGDEEDRWVPGGDGWWWWCFLDRMCLLYQATDHMTSWFVLSARCTWWFPSAGPCLPTCQRSARGHSSTRPFLLQPPQVAATLPLQTGMGPLWPVLQLTHSHSVLSVADSVGNHVPAPRPCIWCCNRVWCVPSHCYCTRRYAVVPGGEDIHMAGSGGFEDAAVPDVFPAGDASGQGAWKKQRTAELPTVHPAQ